MFWVPGACPTSAGGPVRSRDQMGHKVGHALRIGRAFLRNDYQHSFLPLATRVKTKVREFVQKSRVLGGPCGPAEVADLAAFGNAQIRAVVGSGASPSPGAFAGAPTVDPGRATPTSGRARAAADASGDSREAVDRIVWAMVMAGLGKALKNYVTTELPSFPEAFRGVPRGFVRQVPDGAYGPTLTHETLVGWRAMVAESSGSGLCIRARR